MKWSNPGVFGVAFLKILRGILWYIDGHHDTIGTKVPLIPAVYVCQIQWIQLPTDTQISQTYKGNLSCSEISRHALVLQDNFQASCFKKDCYKALRDTTEGLMGSLNSYTAYLKEKSESQKMHHQSDTPSAIPSDSSHLEYLLKVLHHLDQSRMN